LAFAANPGFARGREGTNSCGGPLINGRPRQSESGDASVKPAGSASKQPGEDDKQSEQTDGQKD
jgi:hypothetical protein